MSTRTGTICPVCGFATPKTGIDPRSIDQHRRYFAVIRAVFYHWPESHERQFTDETELRKWLQMKAGYREIGAQMPLAGINKEKALLLAEAAIRAAGSYAMPVLHGSTLVVFRPKSIAFNRLSHLAFCELNKTIEDIIRAETGLDPEQVLIEQEGAA